MKIYCIRLRIYTSPAKSVLLRFSFQLIERKNAHKLKGQGQAKTYVIITAAGSVVIATSSAAINSIVAPTATTAHPT